MSAIILRKYTDSDEITLKNIIKDDNTHYSKDLSERDKITVAEYNGVIAGYLYASIAAGNCQAYIYISPEYRRRGIGTMLCHEAERQCREKNEKEMWGYYYDVEIQKFTDKLGFYFTTSNIDAEYTGGLIPEQKRDMIRNCKEEDYSRCSYIWNTGMHEMRVRVGYPDSTPYEPTEKDRQSFIDNLDSSYVLEENGRIVGHGVITDYTIGLIAVDTESSNKGYGTALAIFMTNEILRRGHKAAYSHYEAKNANSRHVHQKIGYIETEIAYCSFKKID